MSEDLKINLTGLSLANVSNGKLEERFQELLAAIVEINAEATEYVSGSDGFVKSTIVAEVKILHKPAMSGNSASTIIVAGAELKRPKRVKSGQTAYTRDGGVFVEEEPPEQLESIPKEAGRGGRVVPLNEENGTNGR